MGAGLNPQGPKECQAEPESEEGVVLNIYHLGQSTPLNVLNRVLKPFGAGAFHCGVQLYGFEWSFSQCIGPPSSKHDTGVFACWPRECEVHTFLESIPMGSTLVTNKLFMLIVGELRSRWLSDEYDVLEHNCCHFCIELCHRLGVGPLPEFVTRLAGLASYAKNRFDGTKLVPTYCCEEETYADNGPVQVVTML